MCCIFFSLEHYPTQIPAAKKWSIENVETFFKFIGFEDEAPAFREQVWCISSTICLIFVLKMTKLKAMFMSGKNSLIVLN